MRNRVSRWVAARNGYTGYFQLYSVPFGRLPLLDYTEKRDIYLPGGINGGQSHDLRALGGLGRAVDALRLGGPATCATSSRSRTKLTAGKVRLAYLFTAGLDAAMQRAHDRQRGVGRRVRATRTLAARDSRAGRASITSTFACISSATMA